MVTFDPRVDAVRRRLGEVLRARRPHGDAGLTLAELLVSMFLIAIVDDRPGVHVRLVLADVHRGPGVDRQREPRLRRHGPS